MRMRKTQPTIRIEKDDLWITEARRQMAQLTPSKATTKKGARGLLTSVVALLVLLALAALSGCDSQAFSCPPHTVSQ